MPTNIWRMVFSSARCWTWLTDWTLVTMRKVMLSVRYTRQSSKKCSRQVPLVSSTPQEPWPEFMAEIVNPQIGEKMADFACGTGGFITSWLGELDKKVKTAEDRKEYNQSVFSIEKKQFPYMLCVTNLLLHGIDTPLVYHDNSLTKDVQLYRRRQVWCCFDEPTIRW